MSANSPQREMAGLPILQPVFGRAMPGADLVVIPDLNTLGSL
jgi:hypothetical protein